MTDFEFKHWINGYCTLSSETFLSVKQIDVIKNHANLVEAVLGKPADLIREFVTELDKELKFHHHVGILQLKQLISQILSND